MDTSLQGLLWANIGLVGGNVLFPGFKERLGVNIEFLCGSGISWDFIGEEGEEEIDKTKMADDGC